MIALAPLSQLAFLLPNLIGNIYLLWVTEKILGLRGETHEQIDSVGITLAASGHAIYLD